MGSPYFYSILDSMKEIHEKKSADYSSEDEPMSNFKFAAFIVKDFKDPVDQVFATMIAIKLARLAGLSDGRKPVNESVIDSHIDLANYATLWGAFRMQNEAAVLEKTKGGEWRLDIAEEFGNLEFNNVVSNNMCFWCRKYIVGEPVILRNEAGEVTMFCCEIHKNDYLADKRKQNG